MFNTKKYEIWREDTNRRASPHRQARCLFVGDPLSHRRAKTNLGNIIEIDACDIFDITRILRAGPHPELVLSYAISPTFDCLDLAQVLAVVGFRGRHRILDSNLPAPKMICNEVHQACPDLDFGVLRRDELRCH